jgi:hypothetical protein
MDSTVLMRIRIYSLVLGRTKANERTTVSESLRPPVRNTRQKPRNQHMAGEEGY